MSNYTAGGKHKHHDRDDYHRSHHRKDEEEEEEDRHHHRSNKRQKFTPLSDGMVTVPLGEIKTRIHHSSKEQAMAARETEENQKKLAERLVEEEKLDVKSVSQPSLAAVMTGTDSGEYSTGHLALRELYFYFAFVTIAMLAALISSAWVSPNKFDSDTAIALLVVIPMVVLAVVFLFVGFAKNFTHKVDSLNADDPNDTAVGAHDKHKRHLGILWGVILVCFILVVVGTAYVISNDKTNGLQTTGIISIICLVTVGIILVTHTKWGKRLLDHNSKHYASKHLLDVKENKKADHLSSIKGAEKIAENDPQLVKDALLV